jgi:hypothetical protein
MDLLSIFVIALAAILGYVYWVQGLVSGLISAMCALFAATLAISLAEPVMMKLLGGRLADTGYSLTLCGLFVLLYLVLRVIVDKLVPGNVRFPALMDHIGGAVGGLVSGVIGGGILAIATQSLPLGTNPLGTTRFQLSSRTQINITNDRGNSYETQVIDEIKNGSTADNNRAGMYLPFDNWLVAITNRLSDGALAGDASFAAAYPDFLDELAVSRAGVPAGAKHVALNGGANRNDVTVDKLFVLPGTAKLPQVDGEIKIVRPTDLQNLPRTATAENGLYLIVRAKLASDAADKDNRIRFGPGSASLTFAGHTYFPVGVMENGTLVRQLIDDPLAIQSGGNAGVDLVYDVPPAVLNSDPTAKPADPDKPIELKTAANLAFRFKRFGRVDLSARDVTSGVPTPGGVSGVLRKRELAKQNTPVAPPAETPPAENAAPAERG